jgi:hypothetical protein
VTCGACWSELEIPDDAWRAVVQAGLEAPDGTAGRSAYEHMLWCQGFRFGYRLAVDAPRCTGCGNALELQAALADPEVHCTQCGQAARFSKVPDWFAELAPRARLLFGVPDEAVEQQTAPAALHPVLMSCLNCGAKLEIKSDTERVTTCAYCEADHYVPDDVWRRLHPTKKRTPWYVVLGDPVSVVARPSPAAAPRIACSACDTVVLLSTTYVTAKGTLCESCYRASS